MQKLRLIGFALLGLSMTWGAHADEKRYISDDLITYIHSGPGNQYRIVGTLNAGEELWERIRTVLQEPAPDTAVLTCFYRALTLGFVGRYREQGDERREDVVRKLGQLVPPFASPQETPVVSRSARLRAGRKTYWLSWALGAGILVALWFFLSTTLANMVSQLVGIK